MNAAMRAAVKERGTQIKLEKRLHETTEEEREYVRRVNLKAVFFGCHTVRGRCWRR